MLRKLGKGLPPWGDKGSAFGLRRVDRPADYRYFARLAGLRYDLFDPNFDVSARRICVLAATADRKIDSRRILNRISAWTA
jgi:hypothetical protein